MWSLTFPNKKRRTRVRNKGIASVVGARTPEISGSGVRALPGGGRGFVISLPKINLNV
ncbi:MAG: hypothetical protein GX361_06915 [Bacteroidales bacterium]|nr:hypothetical protein [Bacteroidales bacterium]